jgi:hypothetical protein
MNFVVRYKDGSQEILSADLVEEVGNELHFIRFVGAGPLEKTVVIKLASVQQVSEQ